MKRNNKIKHSYYELKKLFKKTRDKARKIKVLDEEKFKYEIK